MLRQLVKLFLRASPEGLAEAGLQSNEGVTQTQPAVKTVGASRGPKPEQRAFLSEDDVTEEEEKSRKKGNENRKVTDGDGKASKEGGERYKEDDEEEGHGDREADSEDCDAPKEREGMSGKQGTTQMAKVAKSTCGPSEVEKAGLTKLAVSASSDEAQTLRADANLSSTNVQHSSEQQSPCASGKQGGDGVCTPDPDERGMPHVRGMRHLSDAAMKDLIDIVEALTRSPSLPSPEALNWRDPKHGMTALGFAALWGFRNVVGLLLRHCYEHGVEVAPLLERHGLTPEFHTPLFTAAIDGHDDLLTHLVPHIPVDHPVMTEYWQVTPGQSLSHASVINASDGVHEAVTLGMCVAAMGHPDMLRSLLAAGAPMTGPPTNRWLTDALTLAIDYPDLTPPIPLGEAAAECRPSLTPVGVVPRPPCQGASGEAPLGRMPSASGEAQTHQAVLSKTEPFCIDNAHAAEPKGGALGEAVEGGMLSPDAGERLRVKPDAGEVSPDAGERSRVEPEDKPRTSLIAELMNTLKLYLDNLGVILSGLEPLLKDLLEVDVAWIISGPALDGIQCQATPTEADIAEGLGIKREMVALWRYLRFELADWHAALVRVAELNTVNPDVHASLWEFSARVKSCESASMAMIKEACDRTKKLAKVRLGEELQVAVKEHKKAEREKAELEQQIAAARQRRHGGGGASKAVLKAGLGTLPSNSHAGGGHQGSMDAASAADEECPPAPQPTAPNPLTGPQPSTQCADAANDALEIVKEAGTCPVAACQKQERDAGTSQPDSPHTPKRERDGDERQTRESQSVCPEGCTGSEAQQAGVDSNSGAGEGHLRGGGELRRGHLDCILLLLRTRMYGITPRQRSRIMAALDRANDNVMVVRRLRRFMDSCLRECKFCGQWGHWHVCRRCLCTPYCSQAHQKADWRQHKQTCSSDAPSLPQRDDNAHREP